MLAVVTIAVAENVDEAVKLANASTYSLTSALWTKDMDLAFKISRRLRIGHCKFLALRLSCFI